MKVIITAIVFFMATINSSYALFRCKHDDRRLSLQHKELCELDARARRVQNGVRRLPWLYLYKEGKSIRCLTKSYRNAVNKLTACTNFTYDNTFEDRVVECGRQMDEVWKRLYAMSDYFEWNANIITMDKFAIMVQNRYSVGKLMNYTKYSRIPDRNYRDWVETSTEFLETLCQEFDNADQNL